MMDSLAAWTPLALIWGVAVAASVAVTGFAALGGLGDIPQSRSLHTRTTPTAGGLGIIAGLGTGLWLASYQMGGAPSGLLVALAGAVALVFAAGVTGLFDDAYRMRARIKFTLIVGLAILATRWLGPIQDIPAISFEAELPYWAGFAGTVLWIVTVTNAVNFMDGSNGLLGAAVNAALIGIAGWAAGSGAGAVALMAVALSGGLTGFLPYNFRAKAKVFAGDAGALPTGFALGVMPLLPGFRGEALLLVPFVLLPLLADVFQTLLRRVRRGENLGHAHREHLYQYLVERWGHVAVAWVYAGLTLAFSFAGVALLARGWGLPVEGVAAAGVALMVTMLLATQALRSGAPPHSRRELPEPRATARPENG